VAEGACDAQGAPIMAERDRHRKGIGGVTRRVTAIRGHEQAPNG
jgi:hypothetical protein